MDFQSESSFERLTSSEKLKMTSRNSLKENINQAQRERSSTSINQYTETDNELERELSLLRQKQIKEKPKIFHLSDTYQFHQINKTTSIHTKKQKNIHSPT